MSTFPIKQEIIDQFKEDLGIKNIAYATIRQIVNLVNKLEQKYQVQFIRTEMGVPGLPANRIGPNAEIKALNEGVASAYPPIEGIATLKTELARFASLFLNIDITPEGCIPTVGSMQGAFVMFLVANRRDANKTKTLFIDPGFPVQKRQLAVLGMTYESFDLYNYRGEKLKDKLEEFLQKGDISTILYSNPNNPSWVCFTEKELKIIGDMANKYDVIILEDLAYFGMDFRENFGKPGLPPYQPTVAHYTTNYVLLFSGSKIFSYAGQRIGALLISDALFHKRYPDLTRLFNTDRFGLTILQEGLYTASAGTSHSAQFGFAAMLKAVNSGEMDFVSEIKTYGDRAKVMKQLFLNNGFHIVYNKDEDRELADGFYFTIAYNNMKGDELLNNLIKYGISAITLDTTGSTRTEGLRICVSQTGEDRFDDLKERLQLFKKAYPTI
ncbi:aminotransferase class I/II-fold pyridoxal phosphate-dependent enzyme [Geofilum sp. OHC36d9]|uniref:aminotransferase class I/II-fold pyridoxal phosphate-dependent enzyme n=1 Tax=Geofilum sp. OHC36d9 TaxID=3458413 RepID=UPI004033D3E2